MFTKFTCAMRPLCYLYATSMRVAAMAAQVTRTSVESQERLGQA